MYKIFIVKGEKMNTNPILQNSFTDRPITLQGQPMTVSGVMNKLCFLAVLMTVSGAATWYQFSIGNIDKVNLLMYGGMIVGFILALVASFVRKSAPYVVPLYAFAEGAFLSGLSCFFEAMFPGIVVKAVSLTFLTIFAMYFLYVTRIITVTEKLKSTIITMTFAIIIFYLITWILAIFHINIPMLYSNSPLAIGFSVLVTGLAAFNLLIDFDFIERGEQMMLPKDYEWYGAFGLMLTLVWLYLEILRLLSKIDRR